MTKTQAIKTARDSVSEIYKSGENYTFSSYNNKLKAWSESLQTEFWTAKARRSAALIQKAREALGYCNGDEYVEYDGGPWTDYIDDDFNDEFGFSMGDEYLANS